MRVSPLQKFLRGVSGRQSDDIFPMIPARRYEYCPECNGRITWGYSIEKDGEVGFLHDVDEAGRPYDYCETCVAKVEGRRPNRPRSTA